MPVKSLLIVPLFACNRWWGFIGFDDCASVRDFSNVEIDIFGSVGTMVVSVIVKDEIEAELIEAEERASRDNLTKFYNRRGFLQKGRQFFIEYTLRQEPVSVMFFDLDFFKNINDTYGHHFGDEVLAAFARTLKKVRPSDLVCRYGGVEFVVFLGNASSDDLDEIIARINNSLKEIPWSQEGFSVTSSIGIMSAIPGPTDVLEDFIEKGDIALYAAKEAGRNRAIRFTDFESLPSSSQISNN